MIVLRCSSCEKEVEITEPLANQTIACPKCGQMLAKGSGVKNPSGTENADTIGDTLNIPARKVDTDANEFPFLLPPQDKSELGRLGRYRVLSLIGKGGMAMVFKAEDTGLQREVALKVMKPDSVQGSFAHQRFLREARVMASLRDDHIVTIYDVDQEGTYPYIAMELLQGETLDYWLRKNRPTLENVLDLGTQIAQGLAVAHEKGLIHRDVKPGNIWVERRDDGKKTRDEKSSLSDSFSGLRSSPLRIKLLDFGLARLAQDTNLTCTGAVVGTPAYMAPEQADGLLVNERSDLFSLGCVLYELSTGKQAFVGTSTVGVLKAVAMSDPKPLREVNPDMPETLNELVAHLIAKNPEDRPASAAQVADALQAIARGDPASRVRAAARSHPVVGRRSWKSAWIAGALAGLAALLIALYFFGPLGSLFHSGANPTRGDNVPGPSAPSGANLVKEDIVLGLSAPFSGQQKELGREMQVGLLTYFDFVNEQGGIAGRKIRLVPRDDDYRPDKALANMVEFAEKDKVFAVIGNVGTPTAEKTLPFAQSKGMLFFGAFSGAPLLRNNPPDQLVFNVRASYEEETAAIVKYLVETRKILPDQIAVFAQQDMQGKPDGYGKAGLDGVEKMLRFYKADVDKLLIVGYERNKTNVDDATAKIVQAKNIRAVVMIPTYKPAAAFIKKVKDSRKDIIFTNVSFVGSDPLAEELGPYGEGVIVTQVVPHPESQAAAVVNFRKLMAKYRPNERPSFVSLEGYIDAMVFVEGLKKAGDKLTTDSLVKAFESIHGLDLGFGSKINYEPSEHQASHKIWGTVLDNAGKYKVLELD